MKSLRVVVIEKKGSEKLKAKECDPACMIQKWGSAIVNDGPVASIVVVVFSTCHLINSLWKVNLGTVWWIALMPCLCLRVDDVIIILYYRVVFKGAWGFLSAASEWQTVPWFKALFGAWLKLDCKCFQIAPHYIASINSNPIIAQSMFT